MSAQSECSAEKNVNDDVIINDNDNANDIESMTANL